MELLNKLTRAVIDPALSAQVHALIAESDFKTQPLTFELSHCKRVR